MIYGINYLKLPDTDMSRRKGDDAFRFSGSATFVRDNNYEAEHKPP
jgi:hypothetical protein